MIRPHIHGTVGYHRDFMSEIFEASHNSVSIGNENARAPAGDPLAELLNRSLNRAGKRVAQLKIVFNVVDDGLLAEQARQRCWKRGVEIHRVYCLDVRKQVTPE